MLPMMIFDPKQPGNDIDVYLSHLIEGLKLMWLLRYAMDGYHGKTRH